MKTRDILSHKYFFWLLSFLLILYGWLIFMQTVTLSVQICNYWTYIAYLSIICVLLIFGIFKKTAYFYVAFISLFMPLDNIFNGLRFSSFQLFYSYILYNALSYVIAYIMFAKIKGNAMAD